MAERSNISVAFESVARQRVLGDILAGRLPPNARLKIRDLSERYGIGASPLREALSRLVPEGLVTVEHNKGFRVAPLSLRELIEITEMRQIVETEALKRAIERGDDLWESEVVASFHRFSKMLVTYRQNIEEQRLDWEERHRGLHRVLVAACGNTKLIQAVEALHQQLVRYRVVFLLTELSAEELLAMHQALVDVALKRDVEAAARLMPQHVQVNVEQVRSGLRRNPSLRAIIGDG